MEMKSGEYSQVATDEKDPTAKVEKEKGWSWKGEEVTLTMFCISKEIPSKVHSSKSSV